jgi:hypothetical protein
VRRLREIGAAAGDLRSDVDASDVAASLTGILVIAGAPEPRDQANRMLNNLPMDGLRPVAAL